MDERIYRLYNIADRTEYKGNILKHECSIKGERGIFKERINSASKDHIVERRPSLNRWVFFIWHKLIN